MSFLGTARALDSAMFRWKVQGACMVKAKEYVAAPVGTQRNLGVSILLNPQQVDPAMLALVAVDTTVSAAITMDGDVVRVDAVTDEMLAAAVAAAWPLVAVQYTRDPLNPAGAA